MSKEPPIPKLIIKSHKQYQKVMKEYERLKPKLDENGHYILTDPDYIKRMALADSMLYYNQKHDSSHYDDYDVNYKAIGVFIKREKL